MLTSSDLCALGFSVLELGGGEYLLREVGGSTAFFVSRKASMTRVGARISGVHSTEFYVVCGCCTCSWLKPDFPLEAIKRSGIKAIVMAGGDCVEHTFRYYGSDLVVVSCYDLDESGRLKVIR